MATTKISGIYLLARLLAGHTIDLASVGQEDPLGDIVRRVASANGKGPRSVFEQVIAGHPEAAELTELILRIDGSAPPDAGPSMPGQEYPELPAEARPDPELASGAGAWLDTYT